VPCAMSADMTLSGDAETCLDVECRRLATSEKCLMESVTRGASSCTHEGYGWNHIEAFACDICGLNFHSRMNSAGFNTCVPCQEHSFTEDIGMSECQTCPHSQKRHTSDTECVSCEPGTSLAPSPLLSVHLLCVTGLAMRQSCGLWVLSPFHHAPCTGISRTIELWMDRFVLCVKGPRITAVYVVGGVFYQRRTS